MQIHGPDLLSPSIFNDALKLVAKAASGGDNGLLVDNFHTGSGLFERVLSLTDRTQLQSSIDNVPDFTQGGTITGELTINSTLEHVLILNSNNASHVGLQINNSDGGASYELSSGGSTQTLVPNGFYVYDNTAGAIRFAIDSSGQTNLLAAGEEVVARTLPSANGGLEIKNASTAGGFEEVITKSEVNAIATQQAIAMALVFS